MRELTFVDEYEVRLLDCALQEYLDVLYTEMLSTKKAFRQDTINDIDLVHDIRERIQSYYANRARDQKNSKKNLFTRLRLWLSSFCQRLCNRGSKYDW